MRVTRHRVDYVGMLALTVSLSAWTSTDAQSLTWLGTLGGKESIAFGVSADGRVVVGRTRDASGQERAFRWVNGRMQDLGTLGGKQSNASGVSADGSVVVGRTFYASGQSRVFRWVQGRGMEDLNQTYARLLPPGSELSDARAISPDGRFIGGMATSRNRAHGRMSVGYRPASLTRWAGGAVWRRQ